ncbi:MAG: alternative ribosome rescue aminoacyl-tRNA hydrolase ArfB [Candidatus Krumholzibacteriia bacterium]
MNDRVAIPLAEIALVASRSSGPGGQHVNKAETRIQLRWNLLESAVLTDRDRDLAATRLASRLTREGELVLECESHRSQKRNRDECLERLAEIMRAALHRDPPRRKTRPTKASEERRIQEKKRRGQIKRLRKEPD